MRILHLIPSMGGGGAERQLTYLCMEHVRCGLEVHVVLLYDGPNMERLERSGAIINRLKCQNNYDPLLIYRIARLMCRIRPDVVQTWLPQMDILGGISATLVGVPFIMTERSSAHAYTNRWKAHLRRLVSLRAALIIANSEAGRDYWLSMGRDGNGLAVIRNAVPFDEIEKLSNKIPGAILSQEIEAIVFAGRYSYEKNLPVMLEAFRIVFKARPRAVLYLYGDGPLKDLLVNFRDRHSLADRMKIGEYTSDLWSVFKAATLFVCISSFEGNPNTVLEAAATGCPMLLSDIPAHREFLNDDSAVFVPHDSPNRVAEGILSTLANRKAAQERATHAWEQIARWSPASIAAEHLALYDKITGLLSGKV
jgi:glycosyltransferase involved in cell wall biosynthesis